MNLSPRPTHSFLEIIDLTMITFTRILKTGFQNFWRNRWLASTTISVMTVTLFIISFLFFFNIATNTTINALQDKIDISVYFKQDASEQEILKIKQDLLALPEIKRINYTSKEQALANFTAKHKDDEGIKQSLIELDENPFGASLDIKAKKTDFYAGIASFLETSYFKPLIDNITYQNNKEDIIEKFATISSTLHNGALILSIIFTIIAISVAFNAIRLVIYNSRREIEVMRLVGAKNWFIKGPFVLNGLLYGLIGGLICLVLIYFGFQLASPKLTNLLPEADMITYFHSNLILVISLILFTGMFLGVASSLVAIRKYLKI